MPLLSADKTLTLVHQWLFVLEDSNMGVMGISFVIPRLSDHIPLGWFFVKSENWDFPAETKTLNAAALHMFVRYCCVKWILGITPMVLPGCFCWKVSPIAFPYNGGSFLKYFWDNPASMKDMPVLAAKSLYVFMYCIYQISKPVQPFLVWMIQWTYISFPFSEKPNQCSSLQFSFPAHVHWCWP